MAENVKLTVTYYTLPPTVTGSPSDFTPLSSTVTFELDVSQKCVNINITDDETVEDTESFTAVMERTARLDSRVHLGQTTTTIQITDCNGMSFFIECDTRDGDFILSLMMTRMSYLLLFFLPALLFSYK